MRRLRKRKSRRLCAAAQALPCGMACRSTDPSVGMSGGGVNRALTPARTMRKIQRFQPVWARAQQDHRTAAMHKPAPRLQVELVCQDETPRFDPFWDGPRLQPAFVAQLLGQVMPAGRARQPPCDNAYGKAAAHGAAGRPQETEAAHSPISAAAANSSSARACAGLQEAQARTPAARRLTGSPASASACSAAAMMHKPASITSDQPRHGMAGRPARPGRRQRRRPAPGWPATARPPARTAPAPPAPGPLTASGSSSNAATSCRCPARRRCQRRQQHGGETQRQPRRRPQGAAMRQPPMQAANSATAADQGINSHGANDSAVRRGAPSTAHRPAVRHCRKTAWRRRPAGSPASARWPS